MMFEGVTKQPVSLLDLCMRTAIDNVRYIGYVGGIEFKLLERILEHCTLEQLKRIEDCTNDTDLSPVTDKFWKRFYEKDFGEDNMNDVVEEMDRNDVYFKWRELYEAKVKDVEEREKETTEKLKKSYNKEDARKQSRQTKLCAKAPPSKKPFWGNSVSGYNVSNVRSNIMKKAKLDLLKSQEVKNLTAIKRKTIHKSLSISAPMRTGFSTNAPSTSRSIPCGDRNLPPRRINSLLGTGPPTSRTIPCGESNLPPGRINSLLGTAPPTSRTIPCGERNLPPRRINRIPGTAPSTSRSILCGERNIPPKSIHGLLGTAPTTSRSIPCSEENRPAKRINSLLGTAPSNSRNVHYDERNLPPKRVNSLLGTAPSTARSNPYGERNLPPKRVNSLPGTAPSTSRSNPCGERDLPAKRINSILGTAPSTSRSVPGGERVQPPKSINGLLGTAPSTSRNAATKRKHVM